MTPDRAAERANEIMGHVVAYAVGARDYSAVSQSIAAALRREREEALREAAKKVCYGCRLEVPFEDKGETYHYPPKTPGEGVGSCQSIGIRWLLLDADGGLENG